MDRAGAILVADDDADVLTAARLALSPYVERVETASSIKALEGHLAEQAFEAVLLDLNFAVGDQSAREGLSGLDRICARDAAPEVVVMTAFGGVALAVEALKRGAADFVLKPWRNEALAATVIAAAAKARRRRDAENLDLDGLERQAIERALARHDGNIARAAKALGLTRPALYRRMAKHGL
jgi:DNA-binding NtrC family response regulator